MPELKSRRRAARRSRSLTLFLIRIVGIGIWQVTARRASKESAGGGAGQQVEAKTDDQQKRADEAVNFFSEAREVRQMEMIGE